MVTYGKIINLYSVFHSHSPKASSSQQQCSGGQVLALLGFKPTTYQSQGRQFTTTELGFLATLNSAWGYPGSLGSPGSSPSYRTVHTHNAQRQKGHDP